MAAYIIKSWRWKLICLCAWNVNAAHTHTHTDIGTPFVVVVGQAGTCVVRVTACVCVWVSLACERHLFESFLTAAARHTLKTHTYHTSHSHTGTLSHTHTKTDTHTTHHTHTHHTSHTDTRNRCINCWRRLFDLFLARTVPHTHTHTMNTPALHTHFKKTN